MAAMPPVHTDAAAAALYVCKSRNSFGDALFTQGLMALMQPIICCVRAQYAREFVRCDRVLRRCHAAPKRCGSELEL
eukprot:scaffold117408_cov36-Phaeocystis_antarctica.AAC.1